MLTATYIGDSRILTTHPSGLPMILDANDLTVTPQVLHGRYEPTLVNMWRHLVAPGSCVVDFGANQGFHTLALALCVGTEGLVAAFEPTPHTFEILQANFTMCGMMERVQLRQAAIHTESGRVKFRQLRGISAGNHIDIRPGDDWTQFLPGDRIEVDAVSVSDFMASLGRTPDLVKMDVEGMELPILEQLLPLVSGGAGTTIVVEIIPGSLTPFGGVAALMELTRSHGCGFYSLEDGLPSVDEDYIKSIVWEDLILAPPAMIEHARTSMAKDPHREADAADQYLLQRVKHLEREVTELNQVIAGMLRSRSWRYTAPLRRKT